MVISAVYGLRAVACIFFGPHSEAFEKHLEENAVKDITVAEKIPIFILFVSLVVIGLWPRSITDEMNRALEAEFKTIDAELATLKNQPDESGIEFALSEKTQRR